MYRHLCLGITIISCFLVGICAKAQDNASLNGFGVETNAMFGKIIRHSPKFTAPIPELSSAMEVNLAWQTYGRKRWEQKRNFPQVGVGIVYTDYGLNSVFGHCIGVNANMQVPLMRRGRVEWTCRFGLGLAYVTKKYQDYAPFDTINNAVSSHVNAFPVLVSDLRYHINNHWDIQGGVNFTHISNALYSEPNLGVNMVGLHIGTRYFPVTNRPKCIACEVPRLKSRFLVEMRTAISYKHARAEGSPVLPAYVGALAVSKRWLGKNKVYAGVDYVYHQDVYAFLKNYGVDIGVEKQHSWDGTFFAGNEFIVGRVGITMQAGAYYHQTFLHFDTFVEKFGLKYYLFSRERGPVKELFLSAMLTTHGVVAEYSDFGVGFAF